MPDALSRAPIGRHDVPTSAPVPESNEADQEVTPLNEEDEWEDVSGWVSDDVDSSDESMPIEHLNMITRSTTAKLQGNNPSTPKYLKKKTKPSRKDFNVEIPKLNLDFSKTTDSCYVSLRNLISKRPEAFAKYFVSENKILRRYIDPITHVTSHLWVVPRESRQEIIGAYHKSIITGHLGRDRTHDLIKQRFYWPNMLTDVNTLVVRRATPTWRTRRLILPTSV